MENIKEELKTIWESEYFKNGQKYFWLYNYNFFKILDELEFQEVNASPIHEDKEIFAVGGTSPDGPESYLLFDRFDFDKIYIQSNRSNIQPTQPRKVAVGIIDLFNEPDYSKCLIAKDDNSFWSWLENVYHSYEITGFVPKGVLPNIDLRIYFKNNFSGIFLSDHKEINQKEFIAYFGGYSADNLVPEDFFDFRPSKQLLLNLVKSINDKLCEEVFYVVIFNPSGYLGIGNFKLLQETQKNDLIKYGLLIS